MKRVIAIALLSPLGAAIGMWAAAAWIAARYGDESRTGHVPGPRVVLPATRCDLGTVPADKPFEVRFTIRNAGKTRLIVNPEIGACCEQSELNGTVMVMPGRSAQLVVAGDPAAYGDRLETAVTYTTNDSALPRFELKVFGRIAKSKSESGDVHPSR
jgi:hypothetical protein